MARLGFRPSPELLNHLLFMAYVKAEQLNAQELANLGWALATMQVCALVRALDFSAGPRMCSRYHGCRTCHSVVYEDRSFSQGAIPKL